MKGIPGNDKVQLEGPNIVKINGQELRMRRKKVLCFAQLISQQNLLPESFNLHSFD